MLVSGLRSTRRPGFKIFEAAIDDGSGSLRAVWLNQPFLRDIFMRGQHVVLYGLVEMRGSVSLQLTNPQYEILDDEDGETIHTGRIVPVYEKTGTRHAEDAAAAGATTSLQQLPADLPDPLPEDVRLRLGLPSRYAALLATHFPPADAPIEALNAFATPAQRRLIFEEAFLFQMGVLARRQTAAAEQKPVPIRVDDRIRDSARAVLPFRLTDGQKQALKEIVDDLQRPQPMNRLLQGDVGAGKTIVALLAALVAMENGLQVAFMAPTEILAEQHFVEHLAAAAAVALSRRAADRIDGDAPRGASSSPRSQSGAHQPRRRHACARAGRRALSRSSVSSSSTSSTGSACCSARRCAPRGCIPTCW